MILLLFGPPGCGKGTQAPLLSERLGIPAISTGDMLRREAEKQTERGRAIDQLLAEGRLVEDALVNELLEARLAEPDCGAGCLIDGYPRTVEQASHLMETLERLGHTIRMPMPVPVLVHLDVPEETLVRRLSARWSCPKCGAIYNVMSKAPRIEGRCDAEGARLAQRKDDTVETAVRRLEAYRKVTDPVLTYFGLAGEARVLHVEANRKPEEVFVAIREALEAEVFARVRRRTN